MVSVDLDDLKRRETRSGKILEFFCKLLGLFSTDPRGRTYIEMIKLCDEAINEK